MVRIAIGAWNDLVELRTLCKLAVSIFGDGDPIEETFKIFKIYCLSILRLVPRMLLSLRFNSS